MNMVLGELAQSKAAGPEQTAGILEELRSGGTSAADIEAAELDVAALAFIVVAAFRAHGHISNVMTHISGARWDRVEEALYAILDPRAEKQQLTPLAENIVDLLCADRGVTGRIVKPYFEALLGRILPADVAARLCAHVACLFRDQADRGDSAGRYMP